MELLVSVSTRSGRLVSPLESFGNQYMGLIVHGPESVQELRETNCKNYSEFIMKWLSSIRLVSSSIHSEKFDELMRDFAICFSDANTHGIIHDLGHDCVELTMIFTNMPMYHGGRIHSRESLQFLTRALTLQWQD